MRTSFAASLAALTISSLFVTGSAQAGLVNGGFEEASSVTSYSFLLPANVPGWKTTDSVIELWQTGFNGVSAYQGEQFAEIDAHILGTLYQDVPEFPLAASSHFNSRIADDPAPTPCVSPLPTSALTMRWGVAMTRSCTPEPIPTGIKHGVSTPESLLAHLVTRCVFPMKRSQSGQFVWKFP